MKKATLFIPSEEAVDRSTGARAYVNRLGKRLDLVRRPYPRSEDEVAVEEDVESVAVLAGLSSLELESGYMEMDLDTIFVPEELVRKLRAALPEAFPIVAVVDDVYSDYLMSAYLKAGASAVVGVGGDLFGVVTWRIADWEQLYPYINVFSRA